MKRRLFLYTAVIIFAGFLCFFGIFVYAAHKVTADFYALLPPLALILATVVVPCFVFTRGIIHRITKTFESIEKKLRLLSSGEYTSEPISGSYDEINKITREIDEIAQILQKNFDALRDEKSKLDYILNNIGDGLFVVDENKTIALINAAALGIFNATSDIAGKNLNYLSYDKTLSAAVNDCVALGKNALFEIALNGRIYLVTVKRLHDNVLTMVVLSDVTESRENAKRREEFFANASHELKTPLTAIKGFNELTAINNKDENIRKYIDSITRETDRMLSLIGDMLKLSELENMRDMRPVSAIPVSIAKIINEVRESLSTAINEKSIIFEIAGDNTIAVTAEPEHIYELVKNLAENAVRYTDKGGRVLVSVSAVTSGGKNKTARLTVSDNGIGISPEEQSRIFERFYRAEKSRSQRNGGTGLGLSIVKHICALYEWKLSVKSKPGVGTEIAVLFNMTGEKKRVSF